MERICINCLWGQPNIYQAIGHCTHPYFEQPVPAVVLSEPERKFISGGALPDGKVCQARFVESEIKDCECFEPVS